MPVGKTNPARFVSISVFGKCHSGAVLVGGGVGHFIIARMNNSLEALLRPLLDNFHEHVKTDPGAQLRVWVQRALELSVGPFHYCDNFNGMPNCSTKHPINAALCTHYLLGYEMISPDHNSDLEKVLLHLFRYRAQEEQSLPFLFQPSPIAVGVAFLPCLSQYYLCSLPVSAF